MSVTTFNAEFRKAQEQLAKHGYVRGPSGKKMNKEEYERFMNSPAMQSQARYDEACSVRTSVRDKKRMQTDKSFKPKDSDWTARKAYEFDPQVDYYRVLGVDEYETQENIKKAYRRLSLIYHPDKTAGMDEDKAEEHKMIFIQINNAYLVLGDNPTRRQYDKKRDDDVVAEELWGLVQKKKAEAQFDAFNIMEEIKAQKAKDSKTVLVQVPTKLEKMFYGGLKTFEKEVKRETLEGFVTEEKLFELFVPPNCKETYGLVKKAVGDHHEKQKPDHLKFTFKAKKHARVQRESQNLRLREALKLPAGALADPYSSGQVEGLGGRVLLFFGRNPFYSVHRYGSAGLRVAVKGEGFSQDGSFRFEVEYPSETPPSEQAAAESQPLLQEASAISTEPRPEPPALVQRRKRSLGRRMECFVELSPFGEPVRLATQPASALQFYGNLGQPVAVESSATGVLRVRPRPFFAIVMSSRLGAKRMFQREWAQIKEKMLPLVWLSFWMLVPPMRKLQPRSLDSSPAFEDEEVTNAKDEAGAVEGDGFFLSEQPAEESEVWLFLRRYKLGPPMDPKKPEVNASESHQQEAWDQPTVCTGSGAQDGRPTDKSRPAWANPEPVGLPVVMGPTASGRGPGDNAVAGAKPSARYKAWRLYPRPMERLPPQPRSARDPAYAMPVPWMRLGDAAWVLGDYWVAYRCYAEAAHEAGFFETIKEFSDDPQEVEADKQADEARAADGKTDAESWDHLHDRNAAAVALARRADCLQKLNHFHTALTDTRSLTQILPCWSQAWSRVGVLEARVGNAREAWEALFRAVDMDPRDNSNIELLQKLNAGHKGDAGIVARSEKIAGNGLFKERPSKAIAHYTAALAAMRVPVGGPDNDPEKRQEDEVRLIAEIYSNRSAALAKLGLWGQAVLDAERALSLPGRGSWIKGHVRLGTALLGAGRPEDAYSHFAKAMAALPDDAPEDHPAKRGREACLILAGCWRSSIAQERMSRFWRDARLPPKRTKVHVISDIHFDHPMADEWVHRISKTKFQQDILIVAGDVAENLSTLRTCLRHLRFKFRRVFFTPGNHDLWIHTSEEKEMSDSIDKLFRLLRLCDEEDIDVFPAAVCEGLFLVPLFSWYNADYDTQDPFPSSRYCFDKYCAWPMDKDLQLWRYMMYLNHTFMELPREGTTITFSHFLPRHNLPFWKHVAGLAKAVGCPQLDVQVRQAGSKCHIFGHSHHKCNQVADGVRYVQNPLGYKDEHAPDEGLFCVFDGAKGGLVAERRHLAKAD